MNINNINVNKYTLFIDSPHNLIIPAPFNDSPVCLRRGYVFRRGHSHNANCIKKKSFHTLTG